VNKYLRAFISWMKLIMANEVAYKGNFILKVIALIIFDFFGPIIALLMYSVSSGIPGWGFEQYLLMVGTFTLVWGINDTFFDNLAHGLIHLLRQGEFDITMLRPFKVLGYWTVTAGNPRQSFRILSGLAIVSYALLSFNSIVFVNILSYIYLIFLATLFMYSINVLIASLAILFVKSSSLIGIFENILSVGSFPLTVYGPIGSFIFTFVFPLGIAAFYPAVALIGGLDLILILKLTLVISLFLVGNILIWSFALKRYTSAGG